MARFLVSVLVFLGLAVFPASAAPPGPSAFQIEPVGDDWDYFPTDEASANARENLDLDTGGPAVCSETRLAAGVKLPYLPDLYNVLIPDTSYGTQLMAETLVSVMQEMRWRFPHADPLMVGDISRQGGGMLSGHRSHRAGRDADVGIYFHEGKQPVGGGFRTVTPDELDLEVNLFFIRALLDTGDVERILLDQRLIRELRRHAIDSGVMTEDQARATFILPEDGLSGSMFALHGVVHHVPGHDNHYHVRVRCDE